MTGRAAAESRYPNATVNYLTIEFNHKGVSWPIARGLSQGDRRARTVLIATIIVNYLN